MKSKLIAQASRLHTHKIVFLPGSAEENVSILIMGGRTTKYICKTLGLSPGQVNYYLTKAGLVGERAKFRNGETHFAELSLRAIQTSARARVQNEIAPKFEPFRSK